MFLKFVFWIIPQDDESTRLLGPPKDSRLPKYKAHLKEVARAQGASHGGHLKEVA